MAAEVPGGTTGLTVRLAGEFAVWRGGQPLPLLEIGSRKARTLLKLLTVERGSRVHLDRAAEVLWPAGAPAKPADNIATLVSRLRAALGPDIIGGSRESYRLGDAPSVQVDLDQAAADIGEARRRADSGEHALAKSAATRALTTLGSGTVLTDEPDQDWAAPARDEAIRLLREARYAAAYAALGTADAATARELATAANLADPWDETAVRLLMRAEAALGSPGRALAAYERLRVLIADEFGVDPAPETREIHLAIVQERLLETPAWPGQPAVAGTRRHAGAAAEMAGRDAEIGVLRDAWTAAAHKESGLVLIVGEAGIGKTRLANELAAEAGRTGGTVLSARCYETERSLFLQPLVEALGTHIARGGPAALRAVAPWAPALSEIIPQVAALTGHAPGHGGGEVGRRRAYDAVAGYVQSLAGSAPVLLMLDDLQNAGLATVEVLHYLFRQAAGARVLIVATVRAEESAVVLRALEDIAARLDIGPLSGSAVTQLATEAGHAGHAESISARTRGHTLFVVETLRALSADGAPGEAIPESLQAAVLARVRRTGDATAELLRAAAVLGAPIEPDTLARMLGVPPSAAAASCEHAMTARLLTVADRAYEFANDLIREVLYATMPPPTRVSYHRRAADLLVDRPEAVGGHAAAAGDWPRAAKAWLLAGELARSRGAAADARALLTHALDATMRRNQPEVAARVYLARGRAHDALTEYPAAYQDFQRAAGLARESGDRRLEMAALRELGGDVPVAIGISVGECATRLHSGLRIAEALGDRAIESDMLARLAVMACNRLDFAEALRLGQRALNAAQASGDDRALAVALDGLKTGYAYLGEIETLEPILIRLEPLLRQQGDLWRLPWAVQESAFAPLAAGDWDEALRRIARAREINSQSGYVAYDAWFVGQMAWVCRLRGDIGQALEYGREAYAQTRGSTHIWWRSAALAQYGAALLAAGDRGAAIEVLAEGHARATRDGAEAYRLRCAAPLAEVTGDRRLLDEADTMIHTVTAPPGSAWLLGAECYLAVGRAWLSQDEPARAIDAVRPVVTAAGRAGWTWIHRAAEDLVATASEQLRAVR